ncbi:hypothetical protein LTR36_002896 [Oleoguttula mirabilis]|uniref:Uncharacterized protein n=1 Tax=Oleoguttula mirabilis TaxID=1507867 RepID=A0AAV9JJS3_9PEZI|nr:hypothetical protein LTR36_002896 [Oleoguttula mirabilis]
MSTTKQDGNTFTARDFELLAAAMQCTKVPVEVDYKLFAEKVGFKGTPSAKASWNTLKKKLQKFSESGSSVAPSLTITPADNPEKASKGSKKRKASDEDDGSNSEAEAAPTKSKKKGRKAPLGAGKGKAAAAAAVDDSQDEDQDDDEELPANGMKKDVGTKAEPAD